MIFTGVLVFLRCYVQSSTTALLPLLSCFEMDARSEPLMRKRKVNSDFVDFFKLVALTTAPTKPFQRNYESARSRSLVLFNDNASEFKFEDAFINLCQHANLDNKL